MALWILRASFLLVAMGIGGTLASTPELQTPQRFGLLSFFLIGTVLVMLADVLIKTKRIDIISSLYFGLLVGLFLTYIVGLALTPLFENLKNQVVPEGGIGADILQNVLISFLGVSICYVLHQRPLANQRRFPIRDSLHRVQQGRQRLEAVCS